MEFSTEGNLLPVVYGNEEETGMLVGCDKTGMDEPYYLTDHLVDYLPNGLKYSGDYKYFLSNGGVIYPGGSPDSARNTNIERATPECVSVRQTAEYIQAHEELIVAVSKKYAEDTAKKYNHNERVRLQRRVVDSAGNRKGCHDNYGIEWARALSEEGFDTNALQRNLLLGHLASRSFIVGSGLVEDESLHFAQKIGGLEVVERYAYGGSMMRVAGQGSGTRLEVRCNDINISPWAIQARIGGVALILSLMKSGLLGRVPLSSSLMTFNQSPIEEAQSMNKLTFTKEGLVEADKAHYRAVDFQEHVIDLVLEELVPRVEIGHELHTLALEIKEYCQDFRSVISGDKQYTDLADRSDHAAKFAKIIHRVINGAGAYTYTDTMAKYDDLFYDFIGIEAAPNEKARVKYGRSYRLRREDAFRLRIDGTKVSVAMFKPPQETRAKVRSQLIMQGSLSDVDWNSVKLRDEMGGVRVDLSRLLINEYDDQKHIVYTSKKAPWGG